MAGRISYSHGGSLSAAWNLRLRNSAANATQRLLKSDERGESNLGR